MRAKTRPTETHSFCFPELPVWFDETGYLRASETIQAAAALFGDGSGGELGLNEEYERGIIEIVSEIYDIPAEFREELRGLIYAVAKELKS